MTMSTASISLDTAVPGMTLSEALHDANGGILLPEGATLTASILTSLQRRGIDLLSIHVPAEETTDVDETARQEQLQQRIAKIFRKSNHDGPIGLLQQCILQYRMETKP
jgi:hypothetical protein